MGLSPFAKRPSEDEAGASRRRSTRIDYECSVLISGRDATGQPFQEETTTSIVNLHGCRLSTTHNVLVGMLVTVESRVDGSSAKAVCVHVFETPAGETRHDIALQLVKPQNIWSVKDPPADWERVARAMVQGRSAGVPQATVAASDGPPPAPAKPVTAPARAEPVAAPSPMAMPANLDVQVAVLEQRAAELMESVLQIIRTQSDQIVRDAVEEFRQQLDAVERDAVERVRVQSRACYDETAASLNDLGGDLAEQLSQKANAISEAAEENVRAKVAEMFSSLLKGPGTPGDDPFEK